jgi:alanyl aminopeptidase
MTRSRLRLALAGAASLIALHACGNPGAGPDGTAHSDVEPVQIQIPPAGQLPDGVTPIAYDLDLTTDPDAGGFSGEVRIQVALSAPHARIWLHSVDQDILSARAILPNGTEIPATFTGDQAPGGVSRLDFESPVPAGDATLELSYTAPYNFGLAGLYKAVQSDTDYLATQMEPIDARRMMPSFDEPRFKTPWSVTVTAPEGMAVVANGAETGSAPAEEGWTRHTFQTTRPIQSYLVALAVGPYDMRVAADIPATALRADPVPLRGFAARGKGDQLAEALDITDEMLIWQESYFDYPYPYGKLDLVAAPEFAYGAMENAGAIIYREAALLMNEQTSLPRRRAILTTHAHELGHQWFGNLVTPEWWNDIWLNEAFATWISYKTMDGVDPNGEWNLSPILAGLSAMGSDSLVAARQIRNPINANGDILDAFDAITYRKGGSVLNMFETYLGEAAFRDGIRLHMRRFEDGVADADDFMQSLADGSGQPDVVSAFTSYISQPGIPGLDVAVSCPAPDAGLITITQKRYAPLGSDIDPDAQLWEIPFAARIEGPAGDRVIRQMLKDRVTEIPLDGDCPDWVMPNADGAGYWRFDTGAENLSALAANFDSLSAGEQIMLADALTSGFKAGRISTDTLLTGLKATTSGHPRAVSEGATIIPALYRMLDASEQSQMRTWVQRTYGPLAEYLESRPATALSQQELLLRDKIYSLLLEYGNRPDDRKALLSRAQRYVGASGAADATALPPEDLSTAMTIGVEDGGQDFHEAAMAYLETTNNQNERGTILGVLAGRGDESIVTDLLTRVLNGDYSTDESYRVVASALGNPSAQDKAWDMISADFETLLSRLPEIRKPQLAGTTGYFCSIRKAADVEAFFQENATLIPGYERSLAQGVERASLCSALRAQRALDVKNVFKK